MEVCRKAVGYFVSIEQKCLDVTFKFSSATIYSLALAINSKANSCRPVLCLVEDTESGPAVSFSLRAPLLSSNSTTGECPLYDATWSAVP